MDKMIKVDEDINVNEVVIYDVVIDYCQIPIPFAVSLYSFWPERNLGTGAQWGQECLHPSKTMS